MKKLLFTILILVNMISINSQEHLTFKGISINGHIDSVAQNLVNIGFKYQGKEDNIIILSGKYIDTNVELFVVGTNNSKLTWKIAIFLPEETDWYSLKTNYITLKNQFQNKYGIPESYEYFRKPYYEGDGYELSAVKSDKVVYISLFKTTNGNIELSISKEGEIFIVYEDKINSNIFTEERNSIINNDI